MNGCTCNTCVTACYNKPGIFAPGEAEKVAEFLGLTMRELFEQYLMVEYWCEDSRLEYTEALSPGIVGEDTGTTAPYWPQGACVFLENDRCKIHPVKPMECRALHNDRFDKNKNWKLEIFKMWAMVPEMQKSIWKITKEEEV